MGAVKMSYRYDRGGKILALAVLAILRQERAGIKIGRKQNTAG